jgi:hypothetical protein
MVLKRVVGKFISRPHAGVKKSAGNEFLDYNASNFSGIASCMSA